MSEKSIRNLLSNVAILVGHKMNEPSTSELKHRTVSAPAGRTDVGSRSTVVIDSVDLSTDEDSDPAVAPLAPGGQQIRDQQSQTYKHRQMFA